MFGLIGAIVSAAAAVTDVAVSASIPVIGSAIASGAGAIGSAISTAAAIAYTAPISRAISQMQHSAGSTVTRHLLIKKMFPVCSAFSVDMSTTWALSTATFQLILLPLTPYVAASYVA